MQNEHSDECKFKDENLLYALFEIQENTLVLISANELTQFNDYLRAAKDKDKDITIDMDTNDNADYQIVYGALMFHHDDDSTFNDKLRNYVNGIKGCALIDVDGDDFGKLTASLYDDICFFEDYRFYDESIPFAALMKTSCTEQEHISTTMFPCVKNKTVWENMINRAFLLACRKFVKIDGLTIDNWRDHIDETIMREAYAKSAIYTGPVDEMEEE